MILIHEVLHELASQDVTNCVHASHILCCGCTSAVA